jgi:hypothetical protein
LLHNRRLSKGTTSVACPSWRLQASRRAGHAIFGEPRARDHPEAAPRRAPPLSISDSASQILCQPTAAPPAPRAEALIHSRLHFSRAARPPRWRFHLAPRARHFRSAPRGPRQICRGLAPASHSLILWPLSINSFLNGMRVYSSPPRARRTPREHGGPNLVRVLCECPRCPPCLRR